MDDFRHSRLSGRGKQEFLRKIDALPLWQEQVTEPAIKAMKDPVREFLLHMKDRVENSTHLTGGYYQQTLLEEFFETMCELYDQPAMDVADHVEREREQLAASGFIEFLEHKGVFSLTRGLDETRYAEQRDALAKEFRDDFQLEEEEFDAVAAFERSRALSLVSMVRDWGEQLGDSVFHKDSRRIPEDRPKLSKKQLGEVITELQHIKIPCEEHPFVQDISVYSRSYLESLIQMLENKTFLKPNDFNDFWEKESAATFRRIHHVRGDWEQHEDAAFNESARWIAKSPYMAELYMQGDIFNSKGDIIMPNYLGKKEVLDGIYLANSGEDGPKQMKQFHRYMSNEQFERIAEEARDILYGKFQEVEQERYKGGRGV